MITKPICGCDWSNNVDVLTGYSIRSASFPLCLGLSVDRRADSGGDSREKHYVQTCSRTCKPNQQEAAHHIFEDKTTRILAHAANIWI